MTAAPIPETLAALKVPITGLTPYGSNPRRGNLDTIKESLTHHGQYRPIVVRAKTFEVLAGNHTLAAAKELGWTEIAATFVDVSDDAAARIVLVDNRAADLGTYDDDLLSELLAGLEDLEGTGYVPEDLANLRALLDDDAWGDGDRHWGGEDVGEDDAFLPRIDLRVTAAAFDAWRAMLDTETGQDDAAKLTAYLATHGFMQP